MTECTTCLYEYQCDWAKAETGPCGHYRPDPDHKEPGRPLDRKSQYLKIICGLAETVHTGSSTAIDNRDTIKNRNWCCMWRM